MDLLWFVLAGFGLTQILVFGSIFDKIRPSKKFIKGFFHCSMCVGFWVGLLLCGISPYTELFSFEQSWSNFLICGSLCSGTSYVFSQLFGDEGINVKRN